MFKEERLEKILEIIEKKQKVLVKDLIKDNVSYSIRNELLNIAMFITTNSELYDKFINEIKKSDINIVTGKFGSDMKVSLINDGPVTIIIDSKGEI